MNIPGFTSRGFALSYERALPICSKLDRGYRWTGDNPTAGLYFPHSRGTLFPVVVHALTAGNFAVRRLVLVCVVLLRDAGAPVKAVIRICWWYFYCR